MKKPEFVGMLEDYMKEISDPKNKEVILLIINSYMLNKCNQLN